MDLLYFNIKYVLLCISVYCCVFLCIALYFCVLLCISVHCYIFLSTFFVAYFVLLFLRIAVCLCVLVCISMYFCVFFVVPVCPHAGGVGLCELVQHLQLFDYICISKTKENRYNIVNGVNSQLNL